MFHHFADEAGRGRRLPGAIDGCSCYRADPAKAMLPASFIASVSQKWLSPPRAAAYLKRSLPPLELEYSEPRLSARRSASSIPTAWRTCRADWTARSYQLARSRRRRIVGHPDRARHGLVLQAQRIGAPARRGDGRVHAALRADRAREAEAGGRPLGAGAGSSSISPATGAPTSSRWAARRRAISPRDLDGDWGAFRTFRSLPECRLERPGPEIHRPHRRRHCRRADRRRRRAASGTPSLAEDGFGPATASPRRWTRSAARAWCSRRHADDLSRRHVAATG